MPEIPSEVITQIDRALRRAELHMIAFSDATPYPDEPRWTPWSRFQKPVAERCHAARMALRAAVDKEHLTPDQASRIAACDGCGWIGNRPVLWIGASAPECPDCGADVAELPVGHRRV